MQAIQLNDFNGISQINRLRSKPAPTTDVEKGETPATDEPAADAPAPSQAVLRSQKRMHQTQAQVDEVTEIMRMNVEKVLERDGMISALDERADALKEGAEMFEKQAGG